MQQQAPHSRRFSSRVATPGDAYVYWSTLGYGDTSRVRDLSSRGLFVQTRKSRSVAAKTKLHFGWVIKHDQRSAARTLSSPTASAPHLHTLDSPLPPRDARPIPLMHVPPLSEAEGTEEPASFEGMSQQQSLW